MNRTIAVASLAAMFVAACASRQATGLIMFYAGAFVLSAERGTGVTESALTGLPDSKRSARMRQILQQAVVPALRDLQFRGAMPHFFRQRGERVDLMSIQFSYQGQHFFVNLGRLELARDAAGQVSKPTKEQLNVANSPLDQRVRLAVGTMPQRLGGATFPGFDAWDFTAETDTEADALMQRLAHRLCEFLKSYADAWWRDEELRGDLPPRNVGP